MTEKRKDNKGRVLKPGESQRKDGIYQYRYTNPAGKRQYVYAPTLQELRQKETEVTQASLQGLDYTDGNITTLDLLERYFAIIGGFISRNTSLAYDGALERLKTQPIASMKIRSIKVSDAKLSIISLKQEGYSYSTLRQLKGILKPAFDMAVEDGVLNKNPFDFKLAKVIPYDALHRKALTRKQQTDLLRFLKTNPIYAPRYEEVAILLGTGMRAAEFAGLTLKDIDLTKGEISVNHQLLYDSKRGLYINKPKSASGIRVIPMSSEVAKCFRSLIAKRRVPTVEPCIDGYTGFLFLTKRQQPRFGAILREALLNIVDEYNKELEEKSLFFEPMPRITPHVLRHTFCTNLVNAGVPVKQVQYLMGHANANVTMNVYAHAMYEDQKDGVTDAMDLIWEACDAGVKAI